MTAVAPLAASAAHASATPHAEPSADERLEAFAALLAAQLEPLADPPADGPHPEALQDRVPTNEAPTADPPLLALPALATVEAGRAQAAAPDSLQDPAPQTLATVQVGRAPAAATAPQPEAAASAHAPPSAVAAAPDSPGSPPVPSRTTPAPQPAAEPPPAEVAAAEARPSDAGARSAEGSSSHAATADGERLRIPHQPVQASAREPAPAFTLRDPVGAPRWTEAVGDRLVLMARHGVQSAALHVHPPELGPVTVRVDVSGNEATVVFGVASAETRNALEAALPRLADSLAANGIALARAEVGPDFGPRHDRDPEPAPARSDRAPGGGEAAHPRVGSPVRAGLVDTFA
jgi:flagellar hook-length control protein FliK